jgi:hypothetical protein
MKRQPDCPRRKLIDDHFSGQISNQAERALRGHLPECEPCREYYHRQLVLAQIDPKAIAANERIGLGLGLNGHHRKKTWIPIAAISAAAAAVLLLVVLAGMPGQSGGPVSRGAEGTGKSPALVVYQITGDNQSTPAGGQILAGAELAFAYRNTHGTKHLMVLGVDEHGNIYWYHPSWTDPRSNPLAIPIQPGDDLKELPVAITHVLKGLQLRIYAIFTDEPLSVREVESMLKRGDAFTGEPSFGNAKLESVLFGVKH